MSTVVVKIGTSSITHERGMIDVAAVAKLCDDIAAVRAAGHRVVLVTSGAIAAGLPAIGLTRSKVRDIATLQAVSAIGQSRLMRVYDDLFGERGIVSGQILIAPLDFMDRSRYLHARTTLNRLLRMEVVPIVNENDALADDEIRFGDNDRIAALVAHLVRADLLVLLTDAPGLFTADPRLDPSADLIEEIAAVDAEVEATVGGSGTDRGSGGMASKLTAAKIAAWSGVEAVIAAADRPGVVADAVAGTNVGTIVRARPSRLGARKVWIAFAVAAAGTVVVDDGARTALTERNVSLLAAGVSGVVGDFAAGDAVELAGPDGKVFAKGLVRIDAVTLGQLAGRHTADLPKGTPHEVVHRDDLVVLP